MNAAYMPILKSKDGEFRAYSHLKKHEKEAIAIFFDLTKPSSSEKEGVNYSHQSFLDKKIEGILSCFDGTLPLFPSFNRIFLDAFYFDPATTLENGQHIMTYAFDCLQSKNIVVSPVVGYERWDELNPIIEYQDALKEIREKTSGNFCVRLGSEALDDDMISEPEYFHERMNSIIDDLMLSPSNCIVLLDFGNVSKKNISALIQQAKSSISMIREYNFSKVFIGGCSMPDYIGEVVEANSTAILQRKEMLVWKAITEDSKFFDIGFSDYGIRNSESQDNGSGKNINGKIWYSIQNSYFVTRGHMLSEPPKGQQFKKLAESIIMSGYWSSYSSNWADQEIFKATINTIKDLKKWIGIGTNRHIYCVLQEIAEHKQKVLAKEKLPKGLRHDQQ